MAFCITDTVHIAASCSPESARSKVVVIPLYKSIVLLCGEHRNISKGLVVIVWVFASDQSSTLNWSSFSPGDLCFSSRMLRTLRSASSYAARPHSSVTLRDHMNCCESTSWLLAALNYGCVWLMYFWKGRKRVRHRVKSFPGDWNQCFKTSWNGDLLPCY